MDAFEMKLVTIITNHVTITLIKKNTCTTTLTGIDNGGGMSSPITLWTMYRRHGPMLGPADEEAD